jgi:hypothetical protein
MSNKLLHILSKEVFDRVDEQSSGTKVSYELIKRAIGYQCPPSSKSDNSLLDVGKWKEYFNDDLLNSKHNDIKIIVDKLKSATGTTEMWFKDLVIPIEITSSHYDIDTPTTIKISGGIANFDWNKKDSHHEDSVPSVDNISVIIPCDKISNHSTTSTSV